MSLALVVNTTFTYKKFNKMEKMKVKYKVNYKCLWLQLILLDFLCFIMNIWLKAKILSSHCNKSLKTYSPNNLNV